MLTTSLLFFPKQNDNKKVHVVSFDKKNGFIFISPSPIGFEAMFLYQLFTLQCDHL